MGIKSCIVDWMEFAGWMSIASILKTLEAHDNAGSGNNNKIKGDIKNKVSTYDKK